MSSWVPLGCDSYSTFFAFDTLTVLKNTGQVYHRMPLSWKVTFFSLLEWHCGFWEEEYKSKTLFSSHCIKSTYDKYDFILSMLTLKLVFVRFLYYKVMISSSFYNVFFGRKSWYTPTLKEWGVTWNSSAWELSLLI